MKLNLFNKFIVAFISTGIVPVLFVSTYSASLFQRETRFMMEDNYRATAFYAARNLDSLIEKYNTISKLLYSYNGPNAGLVRRADGLGLADMLKSGGDGEEDRVKRGNGIVSFLHLIYTSAPRITNVVFAENSAVFPGSALYTFGYNNRPLINREKFFERMGSLPEKANRLLVIPSHGDDYFQKQPVEVFTIGRNYLDLSSPLGTDRILGTLYMDIDVRAIDEIFRQLGVYQHHEVRVIDSRDRLIYTNGLKVKNALEITESCGAADWRVLLRIDHQKAIHNVVNLVWLIYLIVIVVLLVLLALSVVYSNVFSSPIRAILRGMKEVEEGNFNIRLKVRGQDEIKLLADGFTRMTGKLENYIQTSFLSKLRLKEAELSALRARIKPHFLYNSLEIIRMNAIAHDDESTAELSFLLAEFMHTLIEGRDARVPLSRELELLRGYLAFINIRYEGRILWNIDAAPELSEAPVLCLMIQPVVENAVIHGIQPAGKGRIDIRIFREHENLVIAIGDDGTGMDGEALAKLEARLGRETGGAEDAEAGDSIGLKNVHDRLRYTFGSPYGISINSAPGKGTTIVMLLPLTAPGER